MIPPRPRSPIELCPRNTRLHRSPPPEVADAIRVVVAVTVDRADGDLSRCVDSILMQDAAGRVVGMVLLVDRVGAGDALPRVPEEAADRCWILSARCGSASRARNAALEFIEGELPHVRWIARLDWDDRFGDEGVLQQAIEAAEQANARWVLAGNRVLARDGTLLRLNYAADELREQTALLDQLAGMAEGTAVNELPSCNLVVRAGHGYRYPHRSSAEDHWLVANLLLHESEHGCIVSDLLLCDYTLDGETTRSARAAGAYRRSRHELHVTARCWEEIRELPGEILGWGGEGVVRVHDGRVFKHFYPFALNDAQAEFLMDALAHDGPLLPRISFTRSSGHPAWTASYRWEPTEAFGAPGEAIAAEFLERCLEQGLVCANIKRANFRITTSGQALYVDIGKSIVPMDVSWFRDSAARLYSTAVQGASDEELLRRPPDPTQPPVWSHLDGFERFLGSVYQRHSRRHLARGLEVLPKPEPRWHKDVTLLVKVCPMDAAVVEEQVRHLVDQLEGPPRFEERILLVDPHEGPYVRQHAPGDLGALRSAAERLRSEGLIDRVLEAPLDPEAVRSVNVRWFDLAVDGARTPLGVPVAPQLWGFDQVRTRYVLQCDVDVLVGRRDPNHDYLDDMLKACSERGVLGVAFNIPHAPEPAFRPYDAPPGEYVPEVRCGLLDLERLAGRRPLPNRPDGDGLALTWYRSLQVEQRQRGLRTLRGGHHATFYIHPPNTRKGDPDGLAQVRDLVAQGRVPPEQLHQWDLVAPLGSWTYSARDEDIVVLARGRNTPPDRIDRFAASLAMQEDQAFGVIVIDDASTNVSPRRLADPLRFLGDRLTLIRNRTRQGGMPNQLTAVREICTDPDTLVVIVDLDDALFDRRVIGWLREAHRAGHDVVLGAPHRPDRPTQVYQPEFRRLEETFGGDVWIHLRSYRKRLLDQVPDSALQLDGKWLERCNDYATMIPVVRLAQSPVYIPRPMILHERTVISDVEARAGNNHIILRLLGLAEEERSERGCSSSTTDS